MAWFTAEHPVLLAAVDEAAESGFNLGAVVLAGGRRFGVVTVTSAPPGG